MTLVLVLAAVAAAAWYVQRRHRTGPGASADTHARALRTPRVRLANLLGIPTDQGRLADRYAAGGVGERRTAALLAPLADSGWTILHDRALPTGRANVDHLAISPAGMVAVLDSKEWTGRYRLRVVRGRLHHGDRDVTDRLAGIRHGTRTVSRELGCTATPLVVVHGAPVEGGELDVNGLRIIPADRAVDVLRSLAHDYRASANPPGQHPARRAARLFPPYGGSR